MNSVAKMFVLAAFVATSAFAAAPHSASAATATNCDARGIGNNIFSQGPDNSAYKINGNKATVTFKVTGTNCKLPVTIIAWKASNPKNGKPYDKQVLFDHNSAVFSEGTHQLTVNLPDCYFQVDTVTGTKLTGANDEAYQYGDRRVAYMHGGTQACTVKKPVKAGPTKLTPATPATPAATPATPAAPAELPHTGPEAALGTFLATSGAGTLAHRFVLSRKSRR